MYHNAAPFQTRNLVVLRSVLFVIKRELEICYILRLQFTADSSHRQFFGLIVKPDSPASESLQQIAQVACDLTHDRREDALRSHLA